MPVVPCSTRFWVLYSTRGYYHSTHGYCTVPVVPDGLIVPAIVPIGPSIVPMVPQKTGYYGTTARYYLVPARVTNEP